MRLIAPLLAETDFPWVVVVMMFIAFVQWIMGKLRGSEPEMPEFNGQVEVEDSPAPIRPPSQGPPPIPVRPAPVQPNSADELRRFLETVVVAQAPVKAAPPLSPQPIALPKTPPAVPVMRRQPVQVPIEPRKRSTRASGLRLTPQSIRDAVILKEILDPPLSMRDDGQSSERG